MHVSRRFPGNRSVASQGLIFLVAFGALLFSPVVSAQCQCATRSRRLTGTDYVLFGTSTALLATDWLTSVDFLRRGRTQPTPLEPRPSVGRLNTYMTLTAIANLSVARISKPSLRRVVWIVLGVESARSALHDFSIGYHLNFRI